MRQWIGLFVLSALCAAGVFGAPSIPPVGGGSTGGSTGGSATNLPPGIVVTYVPTGAITPSMVGSGSTINVDYNTTIASLSFLITVNDADADPTSLSCTVSNIGSSGIVVSEWNSGQAAVPYNLSPTSGVLNAAAGATYAFTMSATDGLTTTSFDFSIVQAAAPGNSAPSLTLKWSHGASLYTPINDGDTVTVDYGTVVSTLLFQLFVDDADVDDVSVSASISNLGSTGMLPSEWEAAPTQPIYLLTPSSGTLNTAAGVTHTFTLTGDDGTDQTVFTFYLQQNAQQTTPAPQLVVKQGSASGGAFSNGGSYDFGSLDLTNMPSAPLTVYVENAGTADLSLGTLQLSGSDFVLSGTLPAVLAPNANATFTVSFDALSEGAKTGSLSFTHDDTTTATPFVLNLAGTATTSSGSGGTGSGTGTGLTGSGGGGGCVAQQSALLWPVLLVLLLGGVAAVRRRRA
ncbi:MAG: choice-of-anchor D domain-containing protein [Planctomycetes bacterium]|nr:choice-of-anchor D domain-containing protein [Planctomycetota bacterium]